MGIFSFAEFFPNIYLCLLDHKVLSTRTIILISSIKEKRKSMVLYKCHVARESRGVSYPRWRSPIAKNITSLHFDSWHREFRISYESRKTNFARMCVWGQKRDSPSDCIESSRPGELVSTCFYYYKWFILPHLKKRGILDQTS